MSSHQTRRSVVLGALATPFIRRAPTMRAATAAPAFSLPIGLPDRVPGDGFFIRHGYATENTWYNPGWLHAGEDWYALDGETGGAEVLAIADGTVIYAGSDYPGLVVIVQHAEDLFSMYGHLDRSPEVEVGQEVARGERIGTVLTQVGGRAPSHLHFEVRTFLTTPEVNGIAPRYGYGCGFECPPGPGYWPVNAPEHPSAMGWRNPIHVIGRRTFSDGRTAVSGGVLVAGGAGATATLWSAPEGGEDARPLGDLRLRAGDHYDLLAVETGREATTETSADGYRLWYRIALPDGGRAWIRAALPSTAETGSDGRPSSVRFDLLPALTTPQA